MSCRAYGSLSQSKRPYGSHVQPGHMEHDERQCGEEDGLFGSIWYTITVAIVLLGCVVAASHLATASLLTPSGESEDDVAISSGSASFEEKGSSDAASLLNPQGGFAPSSGLLPLSFTAHNFYHVRDGKPGKQYPWLSGVKLVEPYRETFLSVTSPRQGHEYQWEVRDSYGSEVLAKAEGAEATLFFTRLEDNVVILEEKDAEGQASRRMEETVVVKYVRREIRTLTEEERQELFEAMHTLWAVSVRGGNGKELYGEDYGDVWAINRIHFRAVSEAECDHFHDGMGFLTSHSQLTNTFEYSLQQVNPKLTVPYWDFTIETSSASDYSDAKEPQSKSPLFQSSWFGSHDAQDYQVKDGRWAFTEIPHTLPGNLGGLEVDVYSRLRAPWSLNDRKYLTRGMGELCGRRVEDRYPWPSCEAHYHLSTSHRDFYSWVWDSMYDPHSALHLWIGGMVDCAEMYEEIGDLVGGKVADDLAFISFLHRKNLYRDGIWRCSSGADDSTPSLKVLESETCGCLDYDLTQGDDYVAIMSTMHSLPEYLEGFDGDTKRKVVKVLCSGLVNDADHLQAASSLDPTFWPAHPTIERLWMYKRLTGTMTDLSWPDEDVSATDENGEVHRKKLSLFAESCNGHRGSDIFPFGLLDNETDFKVNTGFRGGGGGEDASGDELTNIEVLQALDPRQNKLPYIYDTFEWSHCEADGYDFEDAWLAE